MVSLSMIKSGNNKPAVKISNRILTRTEYARLEDKDLRFLFGVPEKNSVESYRIEIEEMIAEPKISPSPIKKQTVKDVDDEINRLQTKKKKIQEAS